MGDFSKFSEADVAKLDGIVTTIKSWQLIKMLDAAEGSKPNPGYHAGYSSTRSDFGLSPTR